jgi:hypothetical protein
VIRSMCWMLLFAVLGCPVSAQPTSFRDTLLDRLVGMWVLRGTIDGKETTHDIDAAWVLAHQYMQINEVSREKDSTGLPGYEAIVYLGWDESTQQYTCLWLDCTGGGGLTPHAFGHAKRNDKQIALVFKGGDGSVFHTTFVYNANSWQWLMDGEEHGNLVPFARVTLRRQ